MSRWVILAILTSLMLSGCARPESYLGGCAALQPEGLGGGITVDKEGTEALRTAIIETWPDGTQRDSQGPLTDASHHFCQEYEDLPQRLTIQVLDAHRGLLAQGSWSLQACPGDFTWYDLQVTFQDGHLHEDQFDCDVDDPPWLRPGPPVT